MIGCTNEIVIGADPRAIFTIARATERWPEMLPHYRFVRVLAHDPRRVVEMAARRGRIPVRWRAEQIDDEIMPAITFVHLNGWARGMRVHWTFERSVDGTRVRIEHELEPRIPIVGAWFVRRVIVGGFIDPIASRTLRCIKALAEEHARS